MLFGYCVVVDHGIHIARRYQKSQPRCTKHGDTVFVFPVRLCNNADFIAKRFQQTADNCRSEGRVVYIGIPNNIDKVTLLPAPLFISFFEIGRKSLTIFLYIPRFL